MNNIIGIIQCVVLFVLIPLLVHYEILSAIKSIVFGFGIVFLLAAFLMVKSEKNNNITIKQLKEVWQYYEHQETPSYMRLQKLKKINI
jgi:hypothetical protein